MTQKRKWFVIFLHREARVARPFDRTGGRRAERKSSHTHRPGSDESAVSRGVRFQGGGFPRCKAVGRRVSARDRVLASASMASGYYLPSLLLNRRALITAREDVCAASPTGGCISKGTYYPVFLSRSHPGLALASRSPSSFPVNSLHRPAVRYMSAWKVERVTLRRDASPSATKRT